MVSMIPLALKNGYFPQFEGKTLSPFGRELYDIYDSVMQEDLYQEKYGITVETLDQALQLEDAYDRKNDSKINGHTYAKTSKSKLHEIKSAVANSQHKRINK